MEPAAHDFTKKIGETIAQKYRLDRLLGLGGMGAVFEATNTWTERRVALKLMLNAHGANSDAVARFFREAKASARIGHPNVVEILDLGQNPEDLSFFIVMEFLVGSDLRKVLEQRGSLPPREALEVLTPVMSALIAAHRRGIIHRDLKPENIFLARTSSGEPLVKLIDFGIARIEGASSGKTRTDMVLGTPAYMAPEQAMGERDVGPQADVWAMGAVLYECVSGRLPYTGENAHQLVAAILLRDPTPLREHTPAISEQLATVIHHALTRDREKRCASMAELLGELLRCPDVASTPELASLRTSMRGALDASAWAPTQEELDALALQKTLPSGGASEPVKTPDAASVPTVRGSLPEARTPSMTTVGPGGSSRAPTQSSPRPLGLWVGGGLVLAALAAVGLSGALRGPGPPAASAAPVAPSRPPPAAPAPPERYRVSVQLEPTSATLELDGVAIVGNALVREFDRDGRPHVLRARAPGFVERALTFVDSAPAERLVLEALPAATVQPPSLAHPAPAVRPPGAVPHAPPPALPAPRAASAPPPAAQPAPDAGRRASFRAYE